MLQLEPTARLVLPSPISTNALFRNVRGVGRAQTKEYTKWKSLAKTILTTQHPLPRFTTPVELTFYVGEQGMGQMDTDNTLKAATDALVEAEIIPDDKRKWVRRTAAEWVPEMAGCVVVIESADTPAKAADIVGSVKPGLWELLR